MSHQQRKLNLYHSIKKAVTNGWSVPLSSDGYNSYGIGNHLTSDGYGANGFSNDGAWCVISKTIGTHQYEFCLQNDGYMGVRLTYSKLGFDGYGYSLLQVPAAPDEELVLGSGTDIAPMYQQIVSGVLNFNTRGVIILFVTATNKINITLTPSFAPPTPPAPPPPPLPVINKILT